MEDLLVRLADTVSDASDLESLTRPILELLEAVTGMESTYLTRIDTEQGLQHIVFSRNSRTMQIPEGLSVPWGDTLCKRALDEGTCYTADVPGQWGDSEAARQLGIKTYLSQPVQTTEGTVFGTLCAASASTVTVSEQSLHIFNLIAKLIAYQVGRERAMDALRRANVSLTSQVMVDPLTGVTNRRGLMAALPQMLELARRTGERLQVAYIDLDGFKQINDHYGHDIGDRFLMHIARQLQHGVRNSDVVARIGGDEFIVVVTGPDSGNLRERLEASLHTPFREGDIAIDGKGSVGVVPAEPGDVDAAALLSRADRCMYAIKRERRGSASSADRQRRRRTDA